MGSRQATRRGAVKRTQRKSIPQSRSPRPRKSVGQRVVRQKSAHAQLQAVFDAVNVGLLLVAEDGTVQRINNTLARWVGKDSSIPRGKQPGDLFGCIHALGSPGGCGQTEHCPSCPLRNAFQSVLHTGLPARDCETHVTFQIGRRKVHLWLELSADPLLIDGRRHVILALNNITARKEAEDALRESQKDLNRAQAVAQTGSWRLDVRNNKLLWSAETHRIFGIPPGTPLTYEAFLNAVHPDDRAEVNRQWEAALRGEPYDIQHRIIVNGAIKWVRERAELEFDENGVLRGGFGTTQDITDRKLAEEKLHHTAEELARSNEDLARFANVASHDLQEPLRVVAGFLQLLERKHSAQLDAEAKDFVNQAVEGAKRMQTLINDLLQYARVGTHGGQPAPTDAGAALRAALENLRAAIEESAAEITCDQLPIVHADSTQLTQLFQNLVGNALKFRGSSPPMVRIEAQREDNRWVFSVCDNGIGIPPEHQARIFEIFQRLHSRRQYPGTGIGLAICKRIVERHGGQIWVESQPGAGSTFYFTLPN